MTRIAICPGSFDPVTLGHLDIIARAADLYDRVVVGVATNPRKSTLFTADERVGFLSSNLSHLGNVDIDSLEGLLVDFCRLHGAHAVIKGLRAVSDFEYEFMMAQMNRRIDPQVETVFIMASPEYAYLSSSAVKEAAAFGGNVAGLVPEQVRIALTERLDDTSRG